MSEIYFAHSGNDPMGSDWQALSDHLRETAALSGARGEAIGLGNAAYVAGLLHDLGKYTAGFQRRLQGGPAVDHSTAGAQMLPKLEPAITPWMAELIGYAILGHHAGLPNKDDASTADVKSRMDANIEPPDPVWRSELCSLPSSLLPEGWKYPKDTRAFTLSVMGRMIFSCLVDADYRETEAFYDRLNGTTRAREWPALGELLPDWLARFDAFMIAKAGDGELNQLRREVLTHVRDKASTPQGLFTLTVPTGGGKTLTSLGFALDHAEKHALRRIIYAIPFTSIIDQTAAVFREVLGDEHVLEHHSAIENKEEWSERGEPHSRQDKLSLAVEDWAAPLVVTTNVQLFESLFAARPGRARKLHNIAGSIIILDEAQAVPRRLLLPTLRMLEELCRNYRCSVVLCTATQPAFDSAQLAGGLELAGRELAPDPAALARRLRRTTLTRAGALDDTTLVAALKEHPQALVIVNRRGHALSLYRTAVDAELEGVIHLTTRQYAAHRRAILADVRKRLTAGQPCRLIATSLVEAGVDLDFPRVWRAEAGLDQVVQAAGRCNREDKRPVEESLLTVFTAPDDPPPKEIAQLAAAWARVADRHDDPFAPAAISNYFDEVYWRCGAEGLDLKKILDLFSFSFTEGTNFAYRKAAEKYRMIESGMVPVIIPREPWAREWVDKLGVADISSGRIARELQTAIVQVPPEARDLLLGCGHVT
ncbi:MAG: CRISPR-associated helicase Cas3', partial [Geminicoccaceae bacterium]